MFEKLYLIYNPLNGAKDWVSEREFKIGSHKLRNVFGVLYLDDVKIMLRFNASFKESVMKEYNIQNEDSISLHHVCRMISKDELMEFINEENKEVVQQRDINESLYYSSYPSSVELKDGYYVWNEEKGCYEGAAVMNE